VQLDHLEVPGPSPLWSYTFCAAGQRSSARSWSPPANTPSPDCFSADELLPYEARGRCGAAVAGWPRAPRISALSG